MLIVYVQLHFPFLLWFQTQNWQKMTIWSPPRLVKVVKAHFRWFQHKLTNSRGSNGSKCLYIAIYILKVVDLIYKWWFEGHPKPLWWQERLAYLSFLSFLVSFGQDLKSSRKFPFPKIWALQIWIASGIPQWANQHGFRPISPRHPSKSTCPRAPLDLIPGNGRCALPIGHKLWKELLDPFSKGPRVDPQCGWRMVRL